MQITVNHIGKHYFSCGSLVNNMKDRKPFLIKLIELALTQFLLGAFEIVPPCRIKDALTLL